MSTTLILISLFITGLGVSIYEISKLIEKGFLWHISTIFIFISLITFAISLYFVVRTYFGYEYLYLTPQDIHIRCDETIAYYDDFYDDYYASSDIPKEDLIKLDIEEGLIENYAEANDNNFNNNNRKAKNQKTFSSTIIAALIVLATNLLILHIIKLF